MSMRRCLINLIQVAQTITLHGVCKPGNGVMSDKVTSAAAQNGTSDLVIALFVESHCTVERIEAHGLIVTGMTYFVVRCEESRR